MFRARGRWKELQAVAKSLVLSIFLNTLIIDFSVFSVTHGTWVSACFHFSRGSWVGLGIANSYFNCLVFPIMTWCKTQILSDSSGIFLQNTFKTGSNSLVPQFNIYCFMCPFFYGIMWVEWKKTFTRDCSKLQKLYTNDLTFVISPVLLFFFLEGLFSWNFSCHLTVSNFGAISAAWKGVGASFFCWQQMTLVKYLCT